MKKRIAFLLVISLSIVALSACGNTATVEPDVGETEVNFAPELSSVPVANIPSNEDTVLPAMQDVFQEDNTRSTRTYIITDETISASDSDNMTPEATMETVVDGPLIATQVPAAADSEATQLPPEATAEATSTPEATVLPEGMEDVSGYTYATTTDDSFGFLFTYPTHWINVPGKHTVCFRESVEADDFPARVAVTQKAFAHTPKSATVLKEFQSFAQYIYNEYDPSTFEWGELNSAAVLMENPAYEIEYLAYSGDIEVRGYMACVALKHTIYIFHFCASFDDFTAMEPVMIRMRDSIQIVD